MSSSLSPRQILKTWWPLAFSWLLMSVEIPAVSAVIARLADPKINLAAFGGVVYPLALIFESPIVMLLGASVALSKHPQAYRRIRAFMLVTCAVMTLVHIIVVFTPLYYVVAGTVLDVPDEVLEPARIGLAIMLPWTWAIGYRRFQQGVMIRFGHSEAVGIGTIIRLSADALVLAVGYLVFSQPARSFPAAGVVTGLGAMALGVVSESAYAGWRVRPILRGELACVPVDTPLTWGQFYNFYIPLVLTSLISLAWQPVSSAMLARMPQPLNTLAVWPVLTGLMFVLRSTGMAYNEVVVALLDRERAYAALKRFAVWMAVITTLLTLAICASPLSYFYFAGLSALPGSLVPLAQVAFWLCLPAAALAVFQNWFQGMLLFGKRTRGVTESVIIFFVTLLALLGAGVIGKPLPGLYTGVLAYMLANVTQMAWLWFRSRPVARELGEEPAAATLPQVAQTDE